MKNPERCPTCNGESKVINSRPWLDASASHVIARRRERACRTCTHVWVTYETTLDPLIIKTRHATA
jgi:transcriptional regulator NrdR family protein